MTVEDQQLRLMRNIIINNIEAIDFDDPIMNTTYNQRSMLFAAVDYDRTEIAEKIFRKNFDSMLITDDMGWNSLHMAVHKNNYYLTRLFLSWIIIHDNSLLHRLTNKNETYLDLCNNNKNICEEIRLMLIQYGVKIYK